MKAFFQIQKFFTLVAIVASLGFITACGSDSDDTVAAGGGSFTVKLTGGKDGTAASVGESESLTVADAATVAVIGDASLSAAKICEVSLQKASGPKFSVKKYDSLTYAGDATAATAVGNLVTALTGADATLSKFGITLTFSTNGDKIKVTTDAKFTVKEVADYKVIVSHHASDCADSVDIPLVLNVAGTDTVAASGFLVVPHGLAADPATTAPHDNIVSIDGCPVTLGADKLVKPKDVAGKMESTFDTNCVTNLFLKDIFELTVDG